MQNRSRRGFVVEDGTPLGRRYYVVCGGEAEAITLAAASVGNIDLRILRPMAAWDIDVLGLVNHEVRPAP